MNTFFKQWICQLLVIFQAGGVGFLFSMDMPICDQKHFNMLVRSHQFDEARKHIHPNFLMVVDPCICPLYISIADNDYAAASFLLTALKGQPHSSYYTQVRSKKMAKLVMSNLSTDADRDNANKEKLKYMTNFYRYYERSFIEYVVQNIGDINVKMGNKQNTFLHRAVRQQHVDIIDVLLSDSRTDVFQYNNNKRTAFQEAILLQAKKVITCFEKAGFFFRSINEGNPFDQDSPKDQNFVAHLICASQKNDKKDEDAVLHQGILTNRCAYYFLRPAIKDLQCWVGSKKMNEVRALLLHCCQTVLGIMKEHSNHYFKNIVRSIDFPGGIFTDSNNATKEVLQYPFVLFYDRSLAFKILLAALQAPNAECFKCIISRLEPDLSLTDESGNTLLHYAAMFEHDEQAALLIEKGIDCFAVNNQKKTAFHMTEKNRKKKCLRRMIQAFSQACIDSSDYAKKNIKRYMESGYSINELHLKSYCFGGNKESLLHKAALESKTELCHILLRAGISAHSKNHKGETPLECVVKKIVSSPFISCLPSALIAEFLKYEAQVTETMVNQAVSDTAIHAMLLNAWHKQEENELFKCVVCFEVDQNNKLIPCHRNHPERICDECCAQINVCPFCREELST